MNAKNMIGKGVLTVVVIIVLVILGALFYYNVINKDKVKADGFCLPFITPCADGLECNSKFKCATAPNPKPGDS